MGCGLPSHPPAFVTSCWFVGLSVREPNKPVLSVRMASGTESADAILATLFCQAGCAAGAGRAGVAEAPCQTGHLLSRLWLRHEVPARPAPPSPAPARDRVPGRSAMICHVPSLSAPPVPPGAKHDRPGPGRAWPGVTENQSGHPSPALYPCRNQQWQRPCCRQKDLPRGKSSPEGPGNRPWTVLTEEKRPEAFPSERKAGCRI